MDNPALKALDAAAVPVGAILVIRGLAGFVLICVVAAVCGCAGSESRDGRGWQWMDAVAGVDREGAYLEGLQIGQERALMRAQAEALQAEESIRRADERIRANLAVQWEAIGFRPEKARAMAELYEWTQRQDVLITTTRQKGVKATAPDIWGALDRYDYQLANQLLVACMLVSNESQQ